MQRSSLSGRGRGRRLRPRGTKVAHSSTSGRSIQASVTGSVPRRRHGRKRPLPTTRAAFVVLVAVLVHSWVTVQMAAAIEIGCAGSNRNPLACSESECTTRYLAMKAICNQPSSCERIVGCTELKRRLGLHQSCIAAREFVQGCFLLREPGHDEQIASRRNGIAKCSARIALPEPIGCADPCP
jgi:hypothetical protein